MRTTVFNLKAVAVAKTRLIAFCGFFVLAGCSSLSEKDAESSPSDFDDVFVKSHEIPQGYVRMGRFIDFATLSQVKSGIDRFTVQDLLGYPDRDAGSWWFYNINLPLEDTRDYLVCQYRVSFDDNGQVTGIDWRRPQCRDRFEAMQQPDVQEITILSDVLFSFDSSELTEPGKRELKTVAEVVSDRIQTARIEVVGHTDRIGTQEYNKKLSLSRAESVRNYLISQGVPAAAMTVEGRGSSEPLVMCEGISGSSALKSCLQPNRRVQITIHGKR